MHFFAKKQIGQALSELIVGMPIIIMLLLGAKYVWQYAEARQFLIESTAFAAWERTTWEPADNDAERHAVHKTDASLATSTMVNQALQPQSFHAYMQLNAGDARDDRQWDIKPALKTFLSTGQTPLQLLSVVTTSGWFSQGEQKFRGNDPTFNTTTSLVLDKQTLRNTEVSMKGQSPLSPLFAWLGMTLPGMDAKRHLALVTNAWAASPPVNRIRTARQLLPLSTGDAVSGTKPNFLAFFGADNGGQNAGLGDFTGLMPWWRMLAGHNGLAGQFVVKKVGLDAVSASRILNSMGADFAFNANTPFAGPNAQDPSLPFMPQMDAREYIQENLVASTYQRHILISDQTSDAKNNPARNSVRDRRKYQSISLQSPVDTYFRE